MVKRTTKKQRQKRQPLVQHTAKQEQRVSQRVAVNVNALPIRSRPGRRYTAKSQAKQQQQEQKAPTLIVLSSSQQPPIVQKSYSDRISPPVASFTGPVPPIAPPGPPVAPPSGRAPPTGPRPPVPPSPSSRTALSTIASPAMSSIALPPPAAAASYDEDRADAFLEALRERVGALESVVTANEARVEKDVAGLQDYIFRENRRIYGMISQFDRAREVGENMLTGDPSLTKPGGAGGTIEQQPEKPKAGDHRSDGELKRQWLLGFKLNKALEEGRQNASGISHPRALAAYEAEFGNLSGDELRAAVSNGIDAWASASSGAAQYSIMQGPALQSRRNQPPPLLWDQPVRTTVSGDIRPQQGRITFNEPLSELFARQVMSFNLGTSGLFTEQPSGSETYISAEESSVPPLEEIGDE